MQKNVNTKLVIAAIAYAIISQVIHMVEAFLTMNFYLLPQYFGVWSKIMMPGQGPPPATFYAFSVVFALITGTIFAFIYLTIMKAVPGKTKLQKGLAYGFILFLVTGIPSFLSLYLLINLPTVLIIYWLIENLVIFLISGVVFAKLFK
jgi:hypothetical protein